MTTKALLLAEPELRFGLGQSSSDPKEGLFLFGPVRDSVNPMRLRIGVVGTPTGIALYRSWVNRIARAIPAPEGTSTSIFYPGFREIFSCEWPPEPTITIHLSLADINSRLCISERHEAVYETVSLFSDAIIKSVKEDDARPDVWYVVIPDEVYQFARPKSFVPVARRVQSESRMNSRLARKLQREPSLFDDDMRAAEPFFFDLDFRNQLKARLIGSGAVTQIVRESTLQSEAIPESKRRLQDAATVAWNLSVSTFYKAGGKPWKLASVRDGVCYVGLVFKKDATGPTETNACCGAQMFLTDGEGLVFKGRLGPWYSTKTGEFHLSRELARDISSGVVQAYISQTGSAPKEVFFHGKTRFSADEWSGFVDGLPAQTNAVGVRISRSDEFKLYRPGRMPVLRGTAIVASTKVGYLWTAGYIPDLGTYPGWETPNPLRVEICQGSSDLELVLSDVLQLTKLNFNSCIYGDGLPVTLRFADAVGEILTAAPDMPQAPLPFRNYI